MTMRKRWVARCDEPGCRTFHACEESDVDKWDFGIELNDLGWDAIPSRDEIYCPEHRTADYDGVRA